jgi:uncharacterized protein YrzB (UPF0473 family)
MENNNIISLTNEDNEEVEFEIVATFEVNDSEYSVLLPLDGSDEAVIFKIIEDGEDTILEAVEDDDEFEMASEVYYQLMNE